MSRNKQTSSISVQESPLRTKPSVRRSTVSTNPNRRAMTVPVSESFEDIHQMNQTALKRLAKRA